MQRLICGIFLICLLSGTCRAKAVEAKAPKEVERETRQTKQTTLATMPMISTTPMTTLPQVQQRQFQYGEGMLSGYPGSLGYPGIGLAGNNFAQQQLQQQQLQQQQQLGFGTGLYPGGIYGQGFNQQQLGGFVNPDYSSLNNIVNLANLPGLQQQPGVLPFPGQQQVFPGQQQVFPGQQQVFPGQQQVFPGQQPLYPGQQQQLFGGQQPQQFPQQFGGFGTMGLLNRQLPLVYGEAFQNYI